MNEKTRSFATRISLRPSIPGASADPSLIGPSSGRVQKMFVPSATTGVTE
jgi:hypothetical protein